MHRDNIRSIWWYWSQQGGVGKSAWVREMEMKYKFVLQCGGRKQDALMIINNHIERRTEALQRGDTKEAKENEKWLFIFDFDRARTSDTISYGLLESIQNASFANTKYKSCNILLPDSVQVLVFANEKPVKEKMSADRWSDIVNVDPVDDYDYLAGPAQFA